MTRQKTSNVQIFKQVTRYDLDVNSYWLYMYRYENYRNYSHFIETEFARLSFCVPSK